MPLVYLSDLKVSSSVSGRLSSYANKSVPKAVGEVWKVSEAHFISGTARHLSEYKGDMPRRGVVRGKFCYPLKTEHRWEGSCWPQNPDGLLPTPTASGSATGNKNSKDSPYRPTLKGLARSGEIHLWPTPTKEDYRRRGPNSKQQGLPETVHSEMLWPTVRVLGMIGGSAHKNMFKKLVLNNQVSEREALEMGGLDKLLAGSEEKKTTRQLNPTWVEWLMGFPPLWSLAYTDILSQSKAL